MDPRAVKRILVPTDFSEPSQRALETAVAFARAVGATIHLVHVSAEAAYAMPPPIDVVTLPIDMNAVLDAVTKRLADEKQRVDGDGGLITDTVALLGRADTEVVDYATKNAIDLIVMGTHGRSGIGHALLGSVAEKVVQHSRCPVLVVPWHGEPRK